MPKKYKWTVEFEIDEIWIADGFRMTDEIATAMIGEVLSHAIHGEEVKGKVVQSPSPNELSNAGSEWDYG